MAPIGNPQKFGPVEVQGRQLKCTVCGYVHMFIPPTTFREEVDSSDELPQEGNA
jgi:hypothetical protein